MSTIKGVNLLFIVVLGVRNSMSRNYNFNVFLRTQLLIKMNAEVPFQPLTVKTIVFLLKS